MHAERRADPIQRPPEPRKLPESNVTIQPGTRIDIATQSQKSRHVNELNRRTPIRDLCRNARRINESHSDVSTAQSQTPSESPARDKTRNIPSHHRRKRRGTSMFPERRAALLKSVTRRTLRLVLTSLKLRTPRMRLNMQNHRRRLSRRGPRSARATVRQKRHRPSQAKKNFLHAGHKSPTQ